MSPHHVYQRYKTIFAEGLAQSLSLSVSEILPQVKAAEPAHGDLTFPAFSLAKTQRKPPAAIASALAQNLQIPGLEISPVGPYVNARFAAQPFTGEVVLAAREGGKAYGASSAGEGKTVVMDYSSPNIAKPIAFHHIRSTVIGHALANIYRSQGFRVEGINYLGDWGKQFGLVAVGLEEYGDFARQEDMGHLVEVYVKANGRAESDPGFDARAREFFRKMEAGDDTALAIWKKVRDISLVDFKVLYERLGIRFEHYEGESRYQGKMEAVIEEVAEKLGVKESEGALVVDMPYPEGEPPVLLKKNDGSTLYATRDLAAAIDRYQRFNFDLSLYVVGAAQSLHFRQVFRVLEGMGKPWAKNCVHVAFGMVHGMSTRKGQVIRLNDVLDEAKSRALEKVQENQRAGRIQTSNPDALAEQIGIGAIVFGDLKNRRAADYTFNWDETLSFEGHTGPYIQYAYARTCNVLQKGGGAPVSFDPDLLELPEEQAVVREISKFPVAIEEALEHNEPSYVARSLLETAAAFSRWYTLGNQDRAKRINLEDDSKLKAARLALTDAVRCTLASGLSLLGIATPESM